MQDYRISQRCRTPWMFVERSSFFVIISPSVFCTSPHPYHGSRNVCLSYGALGVLLIFPRKFYDLLEVSPTASEADLKKAYRKK